MLTIFLQFIGREKRHILRLTPEGRRLLASIGMYTLATPFLTLFLNAFLWRQSHNILLLGWYNLGIFLGSPIGFYIAGKLLQRMLPTQLYLIGCIAQAIAIGLLIFFTKPAFGIVGLLAVILGMGMGLFWGSRHLLTFRLTQSSNRIYFSSLEQTFTIIAGIIIPVLIGMFIAYGENSHMYLPNVAYMIVFAIGILILLIAGLMVITIPQTTSVLAKKTVHLRNQSRPWNRYRFFALMGSFTGGINSFIPALMVLSFLGKEDMLGIVQSATAIVSTLLIYTIAKRAAIQHRIILLTCSILFLIIGAVVFSISFNALSVIVYIAMLSFSDAFAWISQSSINFDMIEKEGQSQTNPQYSYIYDREIFLALGRFIAIITFFALVRFASQDFALRFCLLFFACLQMTTIFIASKIEREEFEIVSNHSQLLLVPSFAIVRVCQKFHTQYRRQKKTILENSQKLLNETNIR